MTPEEIKETIASMLRIQSELQQAQLKHQAEIGDLKASIVEQKETVEVLRDSIEILAESLRSKSDRIDRQISNLVGYDIASERDRLNLDERLRIVERKIDRLENKQNNT